MEQQMLQGCIISTLQCFLTDATQVENLMPNFFNRQNFLVINHRINRLFLQLNSMSTLFTPKINSMSKEQDQRNYDQTCPTGSINCTNDGT